jgi:dTDP-4-amino-4,6-dideoxygalactose transaminase
MSRRVPPCETELADADVEAALDVLRSAWLTMGPRTQELEAAFAGEVGAEHAVAVSSCSAALHLACLAAGVGPGDEVIVPAMTFAATANAVRHCGADAVLAESVAPLDPNVDPADVAQRITPHTKAVIAVHFCGYPADVERLRELCDEHGIVLIEDCAQAGGGRAPDGRALGTIGAIGCFSFFSKTQLGVGEGGIVVTDDEKLAGRVRSLRSHAMTSVTWDRHRGHAETYDVTDVGFNYRIDEVRAAIAKSRLERLGSSVESLRELAAVYRERLAEVDGVELPFDDAATRLSGHFAFPVLVSDIGTRTSVRARLRERGVDTTLHPSLTLLSAYRPASEDGRRPLAEEFSERHIALPLYPSLGDDGVDTVVSELADALEGTRRDRG